MEINPMENEKKLIRMDLTASTSNKKRKIVVAIKQEKLVENNDIKTNINMEKLTELQDRRINVEKKNMKPKIIVKLEKNNSREEESDCTQLSLSSAKNNVLKSNNHREINKKQIKIKVNSIIRNKKMKILQHKMLFNSNNGDSLIQIRQPGVITDNYKNPYFLPKLIKPALQTLIENIERRKKANNHREAKIICNDVNPKFIPFDITKRTSCVQQKQVLKANQGIKYNLTTFYSEILDPEIKFEKITEIPNSYETFEKYFEIFNNLRIEENKEIRSGEFREEGHAVITNTNIAHLNIFCEDFSFLIHDLLILQSNTGEKFKGIVRKITNYKNKSVYVCIFLGNHIKINPTAYKVNFKKVCNYSTSHCEYLCLINSKTNSFFNKNILCQKTTITENQNYKNICDENLKFKLLNYHKLNKSQTDAIIYSLYSKNPISLIQGPPGTGKTTTILSFISIILFRNNFIGPQSPKILVCTPSNAAIDHIIYKLSQGIKNLNGEIVNIDKYIMRLGISPDLFLQNTYGSDKNHDPLVVCSTLGSSTSKRDFNFEYLIIDEACQATELSTLIPLGFTRIKKMILIGDPNQLPPTVLSSNCLSKSLFERLQNFYQPFLLNVQYRMHKSICDIPNKLFYENQLQTAINILEARETEFKPVNFINIPFGKERTNSSKSYSNKTEAKVALDIAKAFYNKYGDLYNVLILSPYKSQISCMKTMGRKAEVNTIDGAQGSEADVVILSTVRRTHLGFIDDLRRINVGVTRAKKSLIILGYKNCLIKSIAWSKILKIIPKEQHFNSLEEYLLTNKFD
ncbi:hypothetical protein NUSPORA_00130 [Nucleospora cyclopteri]